MSALIESDIYAIKTQILNIDRVFDVNVYSILHRYISTKCTDFSFANAVYTTDGKTREVYFHLPRPGDIVHMYVSPTLPCTNIWATTHHWLFLDARAHEEVVRELRTHILGAEQEKVVQVQKAYTQREAYETNKTLQHCCVCGKPTETRSLCTSNVQYCRCIESLKS